MTDASSPTRLAVWFGGGLVLLALTLLAALMFGAFVINVGDVAAWMFGADTADSAAQRVLTSIRLPRVLAAAVFGAALGSVGVVLQGTYRSPLADAHLLGYSSAAGAGAAIGFAVTPVAAFPVVPVAFAVLAGAAFGVATAALRTRAGSERLILAGVAFGFAMLAWTGLFVLIVDSPPRAHLHVFRVRFPVGRYMERTYGDNGGPRPGDVRVVEIRPRAGSARAR